MPSRRDSRPVSDGADWKLEGFDDHFDDWVLREDPGADLRVLVLDWIMTRHENPYRGVKRESGFDNLWWGQIPESEDGRGNVVICSYFVWVASSTMTCNGIATLSWPV